MDWTELIRPIHMPSIYTQTGNSCRQPCRTAHSCRKHTKDKQHHTTSDHSSSLIHHLFPSFPVIPVRAENLPPLGQPLIQTDRKYHGQIAGIRPRIEERTCQYIQGMVGHSITIKLPQSPNSLNASPNNQCPGNHRIQRYQTIASHKEKYQQNTSCPPKRSLVKVHPLPDCFSRKETGGIKANQ